VKKIAISFIVLYLGVYGDVFAKINSDIAKNDYTLFISSMNQTIATKKISVEYSLSSSEVFARQFLTIQYRLESNDPFITLGIDHQDAPGIGAIPLKVKKQKTNKIGGFKYRYSFNVKYFFTQPGKHKLVVPPLVYSEGGKVIHRIGFKSQIIVNKPLPPYLPPYTPLGDVDLLSQFPKSNSWLGLYETNKLYYWHIYLTVKNVTPDVLPEIRQQLRSNKNIKFSPAEVERKTIKGHDNLTQQIHYSIPFVLKTNGRVSLPAIRLQLFDTVSQRLVNQNFGFNAVYSLSYYFHWVCWLSIIMSLIYLCWLVFPGIINKFKCLRALFVARQRIKKAETIMQLRAGMQLLALSLGWQTNQSVSKWMLEWAQYLGKDKKFDEVKQSIDMALYANNFDVKYGLADAKKMFCKPFLKQCWIVLVHAKRL